MAELFVDPHECEEFWYTRPNDFTCSNTNTVMPNQYRELQVLLDGSPIAIQPIYPVWYTGGYSPETWRAMAGHTAHMMTPYTLDVTPWIHLINDGQQHTFSFQIANSFATFWYISANLLLWRDPSLSALNLASESLTTPSFSSIQLNANSGTLAAPRSLSASRTFTAIVAANGATSSTTLTSQATYTIVNHTNTGVTSSAWNNRQAFSTSFSLVAGAVTLHDIRSDYAFLNTGSGSTRYSYQATLSFNQSDTASTLAAPLDGSRVSQKAANLHHWQGALSPTSSNCRDANSCSTACSVPSMTCGTCRTNRARLEVTPVSGTCAALPAATRL